MRLIGFIIFDGFQSLDITGPMDVFKEANILLGYDEYKLKTLSSNSEVVAASNGMRLIPDADIHTSNELFDTVIIAGGPDVPYGFRDTEILEWLSRIETRCDRCCSICTGAFILGHAGLLNGRHATTHWLHSQLFQDTFEDITLEPDKIFVRSGNIFTSAGVTAGIDLSLALVREDHGPDLALQIAKRLLIVVHRQGGQSQFSPLLAPPPSQNSPMKKVIEYINNNLHQKMCISELSSIAGMTTRTFARAFFKELRYSPVEYIELHRIEIAKSRLESTTFSVKTIAYDSGFSSIETMRLAFIRRLGLSPSDYRRQFATRQNIL